MPLPLPDDYKLYDSPPPTIESYLHLRKASGLTPVTASQAELAIPGSWFFCHIEHVPSGTAVAMGRLISDGGWYWHVADMATLPEHQRKGLGKAVLTRLMEEIREKQPEDGDAYVSLLADPPGRKLYGNMGFKDSMPSEMGMWRFSRKEDKV